jgi:hypothetical protein
MGPVFVEWLTMVRLKRATILKLLNENCSLVNIYTRCLGNICLIIARVFGGISGGASLFQISEAIAWVVDQGANVINMSVGSPTSFQTLIDSVDYAEQQGAVFVASAGYGSYQ